MRGVRVFSVSLICMIVLSSFCVPATAEDVFDDNETITLEELLQALVDEINSLQSRISTLEQQLSVLQTVHSVNDTDEELVSLQIRQASMTQAYILRIEHNKAKQLELDIELLNKQLKCLDKQILIEKVMLEYNNSTQINVDSLSAQRNSVIQHISMVNTVLLAKRDYLNSNAQNINLLQDNDSDKICFPRYIKTLDELTALLIKNNAALRTYEIQIHNQNELLESINNFPGTETSIALGVRVQLDQLTTIRKSYIQELEITAMDRYSAYLDARTECDSNRAKKEVLIKQLEILKIFYECGEISALAYSQKEYAIQKELYIIAGALLDVENHVYILELMEMGIVL